MRTKNESDPLEQPVLKILKSCKWYVSKNLDMLMNLGRLFVPWYSKEIESLPCPQVL